MHSVDSQGRNKTIGGDEYYVTYKDQNVVVNASTLVALVNDQQDGSYILDFVTTPLNPVPSNLTGRGMLAVYFQYSCGIGAIAHRSLKGKMTDWRCYLGSPQRNKCRATTLSRF